MTKIFKNFVHEFLNKKLQEELESFFYHYEHNEKFSFTCFTVELCIMYTKYLFMVNGKIIFNRFIIIP